MKVLFISVFPPNPAPEAIHALHICEHLADSGASVHVLCPKGSIAATHNKMFIHPLVDDWSWSDLPKVIKLLKECRPDVVFLLYLPWVFNHKKLPALLPTICKKVLKGVPCVTQFDGIPAGPFAGPVRRKAMGLLTGRRDIHPFLGTLHRDSDHIIVLSSPHRKWLAQLYSGIDEKTVIIPPPPLIRCSHDDPASTRKQVRQAIGAKEGDFILMFWGYIYPGKGIETLLHAFRNVCEVHSDVGLIVVGGSLEIKSFSYVEYYQMVRKLPEKLGIAERVTWTGHFDWDSDVGSQYLRAGDACILPFDYGVTLNNSSLAAANTHGLPVIATELLDESDEALEHGRHIYLCPPKDPHALAEAIHQLISNSDFRERLRRGSRELAQEWYSWERTTKRLVEVLESAISVRRQPSDDQSKTSLVLSRAQVQKQNDSPSPLPLAAPTEWPTAFGGQGAPGTFLSEPVGHLDDRDAPLVSIVVAVHNVSKYLSQCLDSLVNQTLKPIEIILVNDASTDSSPKIIQDYRSRYPSIRVVHCESNQGLATVRNIGIRHSRGQYIGFADGDDWVDVNMCEAMYRKASASDADVLIADIRLFFEEFKTFRPHYDQELRRELDPGLKSMAFDLLDEPRVLSLFPSTCTKIYKRSFLAEHDLHFEDGMNSYEDVCFHFFSLLKARRISLIDDPVYYYRQNRPGQISGRTSRRVFEVFDVFDRIHAKFLQWDVSPVIWARLVKFQVLMFGWLLRDRVQPHQKAEFFERVSNQFQTTPVAGFEQFRREAKPEELPRLFCLRRNWMSAYQRMDRGKGLLFPLLYLALHNRRRGIVGRGYRRLSRYLNRKATVPVRSVVNKLLNFSKFDRNPKIVIDKLEGQKQFKASNLPLETASVQICQVRDRVLFISNWADQSSLQDSVWRMEHDYYLLQTAVFREGDAVVDVGAHLGVFAIYLAKKFPFITVYALEPEPHNYYCLQRNITLNATTNVVAINKALSGEGQPRTLYSDAFLSNWATIDADTAKSRSLLYAHQIPTVTLEQLFREHQIQHCRMMKINARGAVRESLEAFSERGCIDFLCGEADLEDCSKARLEVVSWRLARHHFWRTFHYQAGRSVVSWIHQIPNEIEQSPGPLTWMESAYLQSRS